MANNKVVFELPGFHEPKIVKWFRTPGLQAGDEFLLHDLRCWLDSGQQPRAGHFPDSLPLAFSESRMEAFKLASQAQGDPDTVARGDQLLWAMLEDKGYCNERNQFHRFLQLKEADYPGASRGRLFSSVQAGKADVVLNSLLDASGEGEADELPRPITNRLIECLTTGWTQNPKTSLELHVNILRENPPRAYLDWVSRNWFDFTFELARSNRSIEDVRLLLELCGLNNHQAVDSICKLGKGESPENGDIQAIREIKEQDRNKLLYWMVDEWYNSIRLITFVRQQLLDWLVELLPLPGNTSPRALDTLSSAAEDPLIKLARNGDLQGKELDGLGNEIEGDGIPAQLTIRTSAQVLRRLDVFEGRMFGGGIKSPYRPKWEKLAQEWPEDAYQALYIKKKKVINQLPPEMAKAAWESKRHPHYLEENLKRLCAEEDGGRLKELAGRLWQWARNSEWDRYEEPLERNYQQRNNHRNKINNPILPPENVRIRVT